MSLVDINGGVNSKADEPLQFWSLLRLFSIEKYSHIFFATGWSGSNSRSTATGKRC